MSKFQFKSSQLPALPRGGNVRSSFSAWLLANHGDKYRETLRQHRTRKDARRYNDQLGACDQDNPTEDPMVGIVGGGFVRSLRPAEREPLPGVWNRGSNLNVRLIALLGVGLLVV